MRHLFNLIACLLVSVSATPLFADSLDGYWVTPQVSYAMKASSAAEFCQRLHHKATNGGDVMHWPSVMRFDQNRYFVCSLVNGPSWLSQCTLTGNLINNVLYINKMETQYELVGTKAIEIVSWKVDGQPQEINADVSVRLQSSADELTKASVWAAQCKMVPSFKR